MEFKFVCETHQIWLEILLKMKPNKKNANLKLKTGVNLNSYMRDPKTFRYIGRGAEEYILILR